MLALFVSLLEGVEDRKKEHLSKTGSLDHCHVDGNVLYTNAMEKRFDSLEQTLLTTVKHTRIAMCRTKSFARTAVNGVGCLNNDKTTNINGFL